MSDSKLRELERAASSGDLVAAAQLEREQCRIYGHSWSEVPFVPPKWLQIQYCKNCLAIQGERSSHAQPPKVFAYRFDTRSRSKIHAVAGFGSRSYLTRQGLNLTMSCGKTAIPYLSKEMITKSHFSVTCKLCLKYMRGSEDELAKVSRDLHGYVLSVHKVQRSARRKAIRTKR